jgi:hypothetical protein
MFIMAFEIALGRPSPSDRATRAAENTARFHGAE